MCNTKKWGLPNTELYICTIHFNNIRDNFPFCRRRSCFPVNCIRTIFSQNVKTWKFHTKVHLRFNECKTFTIQDGSGVLYGATVASSLSSGQWDAAKEEGWVDTLQESQGRRFRTTVVSPRQSEIALSLHALNSNCEKYTEITKHGKKEKIPVIFWLQQAVNINNRNVQVESVGRRFPHALRATWELHASVHEPTRGASLFQICVTAFAYISILSVPCPVFFSFLLCVVFSFSCLSHELQHRQCRFVAPSFTAAPPAAMLTVWQTQTIYLPMLVNSVLFLFSKFLPYNDWLCLYTARRSASDEESCARNGTSPHTMGQDPFSLTDLMIFFSLLYSFLDKHF